MVDKPNTTFFSGKSIHQCFQWIYLLLYQTGILGLKIRNGIELYYDRWSKTYCYLCRLALVLGLVGGFLVKITNKETYDAAIQQLTPVVKVILTFECVISPLIYLEVTFYLDKVRDKYIKLANTFQTLDAELQKEFPCIQWNYYKSVLKYNPMTVVLYVFYTVIAFLYIFRVAHCSCGLMSSIVISFSYACVTGGPGFAGFLFVGNMDMLRLRFRLLRKLMQQCLLQTKNNQSPASDIKKFKILENYFKEYSCLITLLNEVFGVISASGLFHDFALVTSMTYLLCSKAIDANAKVYEYVFVLLFMTPRIYKVISLSIYGYAAQKEVQRKRISF